jgi:SAM-dependent methyltransferase
MDETRSALEGCRPGIDADRGAVANGLPNQQSQGVESQRVCRICASTGSHRRFVVREMMFGTREPFEYFECSNCQTLQIVDVPADLARHYPRNYLGSGLIGDGPGVELASRRLTTFLKHQRFAYVLHGRNLIGRLLSKWRAPHFPYSLDWLRHMRARFESRILDVGCGPGHLLQALQRQGFAGVLGQDKFQQEFVPGVPVERKPLEELDGSFDVIMLHHSFEHMPDPVPTLRALKRLCDPGGTILLRIPVAGCEAWKEYGVNWYQIDAPRHLVIPSERGLRLVAQQLGLDIARVEYDSNETQFGCSEQYAQGVPLRDARSFYFDRDTDLFTDEQKAVFRSRAAQANAAGKGDQACFYLTHAGRSGIRNT